MCTPSEVNLKHRKATFLCASFFLRIMQVNVWSHKFVSHYISMYMHIKIKNFWDVLHITLLGCITSQHVSMQTQEPPPRLLRGVEDKDTITPQ